MKSIWVPLSGALAQQRVIDTIANNVANASAPGHKKDDVVFKEYLTADQQEHLDPDLPMKEWKPEDFYRSYGTERGFVKVDGSYTNFSQGTLTPTGNSLDVALKGPGFIEVLTPHGIRFTRKGNLTLSGNGQLTTLEGYPVLAKETPTEEGTATTETPETITPIEQRFITLPKGKVSISMEGDILVDNKKSQTISLAEFHDPHHLKKEGASFFVNSEAKNRKANAESTILHQGFLEESNVNAVQEMSNLISAHRHFESLQKAIKTYDALAGRSVNDIAKF